jgi:hypothetical protein
LSGTWGWGCFEDVPRAGHLIKRAVLFDNIQLAAHFEDAKFVVHFEDAELAVLFKTPNMLRTPKTLQSKARWPLGSASRRRQAPNAGLEKTAFRLVIILDFFCICPCRFNVSRSISALQTAKLLGAYEVSQAKCQFFWALNGFLRVSGFRHLVRDLTHHFGKLAKLAPRHHSCLDTTPAEILFLRNFD